MYVELTGICSEGTDVSKQTLSVETVAEQFVADVFVPSKPVCCPQQTPKVPINRSKRMERSSVSSAALRSNTAMRQANSLCL